MTLDQKALEAAIRADQWPANLHAIVDAVNAASDDNDLSTEQCVALGIILASRSSAIVEEPIVADESIDHHAYRVAHIPEPSRSPQPHTGRAGVDDAELYVPGEFCCAKCGFTLSQFTLNANSGAIGDRDVPGEKCPNDGSPLWRVTWKQRAQDHYERCTAEMERATKAEAALNAALTVEPEAGEVTPLGLLKIMQECGYNADEPHPEAYRNFSYVQLAARIRSAIAP